ncbi:hypothetical protein J4573_31490 [Actinomadura barringtoniae]|uniref:Uncharacterized protein n=1 Tax=Actinomadura barringtoniae TaxID=1427535 RepID=A0A939PN64_9ACTN|nr:hypothetical protein [Actinomadura barringtoniae]MBO2451651.1 hypothetical protein [Actinomadura barringtoniae]
MSSQQNGTHRPKDEDPPGNHHASATPAVPMKAVDLPDHDTAQVSGNQEQAADEVS